MKVATGVCYPALVSAGIKLIFFPVGGCCVLGLGENDADNAYYFSCGQVVFTLVWDFFSFP